MHPRIRLTSAHKFRESLILHPNPIVLRSRRLAGALCAAAALLLTACGGGGNGSSDASSPDAAATSCAGMPSASVALARINAARAVARACGGTAYPATAALAWSDALARASAAHATEMAVNDRFSHSGLDGSSPGTRAVAAGYGSSYVGENIGAGYASLDEALARWLESSGHCANLMDGGYQHVAVACASQSGSTYGTYWVLMLGRAT